MDIVHNITQRCSSCGASPPKLSLPLLKGKSDQRSSQNCVNVSGEEGCKMGLMIEACRLRDLLQV